MSMIRQYKALRYRFKSRLTWLQTTIRSGPLKGKKWCAATGVRFIRGDYAGDELHEYRALIKPGSVFYDVGAHVGYVSLVAAKWVGPEGRVVAFEPLPLNIRYLKKHIEINREDNVELFPVAVSDRCGEQRFDIAGGTGRGRIADGTGVPITTVSLDALCAGGRIPPPSVIKMDVEGAELLALTGASETIRKYRPAILLSTHGEQVKQQCEKLLQSFGYEFRYFCERDLIATATDKIKPVAAAVLLMVLCESARLGGIVA